MASNHGRASPPLNDLKWRRARRNDSWTTSSASRSLRVSQRARLYAASRCGRTVSSKTGINEFIRGLHGWYYLSSSLHRLICSATNNGAFIGSAPRFMRLLSSATPSQSMKERSEERRVGKSVDLCGRSRIKKKKKSI